MRVVTDLHHSVLFESLAMLFVDRAILGPTELLVWRDGHYQRQNGPAAQEFGRTPLVVDDLDSADYVIATAPSTRQMFRDLAGRLGAVYVDHIGNAWDVPIGKVVLWATANDGGLTYHPEFHRLPYTEPTGTRVGAFHCSFSQMPCWADWRKQATPDWIHYGSPEHWLKPQDVAQAMADCIAIWHCKGADGYGFGVHEAFASGRAVIGHAEHYEGKLAAPLFQRGITYLEPGDKGDLVGIGRNARARFDALIDFDAEAEMVRDYLLAASGKR